MKYTDQKFRLTGISPILGSISLDKEVFLNYLATKGKTPEEVARATEDVENVIENPDEQQKVTGFYRDSNTGDLILKDYQIKGFLKEAAKALKSQINMAQTSSKIDNYVFIMERNIPIMHNGSPVSSTDGLLSRPLRAQTMQGPRVALAYSEKVDEWSIDITIRVLDNEKTKTSAAVTMDIVRELLSYGELKGLLQWRNGGYGQFRVEALSEPATNG